MFRISPKSLTEVSWNCRKHWQCNYTSEDRHFNNIISQQHKHNYVSICNLVMVRLCNIHRDSILIVHGWRVYDYPLDFLLEMVNDNNEHKTYIYVIQYNAKPSRFCELLIYLLFPLKEPLLWLFFIQDLLLFFKYELNKLFVKTFN